MRGRESDRNFWQDIEIIELLGQDEYDFHDYIDLFVF